MSTQSSTQNNDCESVGTIIVGTGVIGMTAATRLAQEGVKDFIILEKNLSKGGCWSRDGGVANAGSRVQLFEPAYRLNAARVTDDYTKRDQILSEMDNMSEQQNFEDKIRYGCDFVGLDEHRKPGSVVVTYREVSSGATRSIVATDHVLLCTGALQKPRDVKFEGEAAWARSRPVVHGVSGEVDALELAGKRVCILGFGAFAIENAREALLAGAKKVTIVGRNLTQMGPKLLHYLNSTDESGRIKQLFQEPQAPEPEAALRKVRLMEHAYAQAGASALLPTHLKQLLRGDKVTAKPTITIPVNTDVFFIAHALGLLEVVVGEARRFDSAAGVVVVNGHRPVADADTSAGAGAGATAANAELQVDCDVVIKCLGFERPDDKLADKVGRTNIMSPFWLSPKVLVMKAERSTDPSKLVPFTNGSVVVIAQLYMEIFLHFRAHPAELPAALALLPRPTIAGESMDDFVAGVVALNTHFPGVTRRVDALRTRLIRQFKTKYTLEQFLAKNRADWEGTCATLSPDGNPAAVPYLWAGFQQQQRALKEKEAAAPVAAVGKVMVVAERG